MTLCIVIQQVLWEELQVLALRWALKVKVAIISETMAPLIYYCGIINSSALVKCMTGNKTGRSAFKKKSLYSFNTEGKNNPSVGIFFFDTSNCRTHNCVKKLLFPRNNWMSFILILMNNYQPFVFCVMVHFDLCVMWMEVSGVEIALIHIMMIACLWTTSVDRYQGTNICKNKK